METFDDLGTQIDNELFSISKYISFVQKVNSSMYAFDGVISSEKLLSGSSCLWMLNGPSNILC